jgi:hypothetical protein
VLSNRNTVLAWSKQNLLLACGSLYQFGG